MKTNHFLKLQSIVLALALLIVFSLPAFAADSTDTAGQTQGQTAPQGESPQDESDMDAGLADGSDADEPSQTEPQEGAGPNNDPAELEPDSGESLADLYRNLPYYLFEQILDFYVQNHLYDFTEEQVLHATIKNMLAQNPQLYKFLLNSMLSTMDPYSAYYEANSGFLSTDDFGYGFSLIEEGKDVRILNIIPGSSAEKAGLLAGDRIVSIAGIQVEHLPGTAVGNLLRNIYLYLVPRDEKNGYATFNPPCELVIDRDGTPITVTLLKEWMPADPLNYSFDEQTGVAYIEVTSFLGEHLQADFEALLSDLYHRGCKKLTIDLRNNGGGSIDITFAMISMFFPEETLIGYFSSKQADPPEPIMTQGNGYAFDQIAVLVNQYTASAAELMAYTLQEKGLATVIGTTTYGKSLGQSVVQMSNGDFFTVTTYQIFDENMQTYDKIGVIPDLVCENLELFYEFPALAVFNHQNYKEIVPGVYSEPALALEQRLALLDLLFEDDVDGIFDAKTQSALMIYQILEAIPVHDGLVNDDTVTKMTATINRYKNYYYREDTQYETSVLFHESSSQAKRFIKEKEAQAKKLAEERALREQALLEQTN